MACSVAALQASNSCETCFYGNFQHPCHSWYEPMDDAVSTVIQGLAECLFSDLQPLP